MIFTGEQRIHIFCVFRDLQTVSCSGKNTVKAINKFKHNSQSQLQKR